MNRFFRNSLLPADHYRRLRLSTKSEVKASDFVDSLRRQRTPVSFSIAIVLYGCYNISI